MANNKHQSLNSSASKDAGTAIGEILEPGLASSTSFSSKPFKAAIDGMEASQTRYYESHDRDTEFLILALNKAETARERSDIRKDFMARDNTKASLAGKNIAVWKYALGVVAVITIAAVTRSVSATTTAAAKLLKP